MALVVVGMGASGRAATALALKRGLEVICVDQRDTIVPIEGATLQCGPHQRATFLSADRIVVSPGVPHDQPDILAAMAAGVPVVGELGFAVEGLADDATVVAITGTNGKSSVTSYLGQLLRLAGRSVFVGGNLGRPLSDSLCADERPDIYVIEASSYQLERPGALRPTVAVILNLTPDHLERHGTMRAYAQAKARVAMNQGAHDLCLYPSSSGLIHDALSRWSGARAFLGQLPGWRRNGTQVEVQLDGLRGRFDLSASVLIGEHNRDNLATACLMARVLGLDDDEIGELMGQIRPLPHRMESVGVFNGVRWINDSKATNVEAAFAGLSGLTTPAVVLLGGQAKGPGFSALKDVLLGQRGVITFGASGPDIADELESVGLTVERRSSLEEAVALARLRAQAGDVVLLSPGCASFDAFQQFEHRGDCFRQWARDGVTR